jgi:L-ascorbate metabolism protein UlaG (beta-lactamase superfamily)
MNITYYGHACFCAVVEGKYLLFDPFISYNELAKGIDITTIPADYILLSHGHQDHIADAIPIAQRTGAVVIAAYEIAEWVRQQGYVNVQHINTGGKLHLDFGTVKAVNAIHSSVLPDGTYGANPMGFVIEYGKRAFYYAGDTALTMDMKLIPMTCHRLDLAILPIGDCFTMGVEDALIASDFVDCHHVLGVHYDTFPPIKLNHDMAMGSFAARGKTLHLMDIGETRTFKQLHT